MTGRAVLGGDGRHGRSRSPWRRSLAGLRRRQQGRPNAGVFYPVKGKVTLPDGKPLASAKVVFVGPVTATTTTQSDGTFTFKGTKDGLPAGDYKVRLEVAEAKGTAKKSGPPVPGQVPRRG